VVKPRERWEKTWISSDRREERRVETNIEIYIRKPGNGKKT